METETTNQWQCDHGRWLEANAGQQYRKGPDRMLRLNDVNSTDNKQPWKLNPDPGPSLLSMQDLRFKECRNLVAAQKARTLSPGQPGRP